MRSLLTAGTLVGLLLSASSPAAADMVWTWSFGGTEAGTFTTEGTPADLAGPVSLQILAFSVTSSSEPGNVGTAFDFHDPPHTLHWDGTQVDDLHELTYFFGVQYGDPMTLHFYFFSPTSAALRDENEHDLVAGPPTYGAPAAPSVVEVPTLAESAAALFAVFLALAGLVALRRVAV